MSASQVTKGKDGERELIRHLRNLLGIELTRNLDQVRDDGSDILGLEGFFIKCKRSKASHINGWWTQAVHQAKANQGKPALCYRVDRGQWRVILALRHLVPGFETAPHTLWLETSLDVFAAIIREQTATTTLTTTATSKRRPVECVECVESIKGLTDKDLEWHQYWQTKANARAKAARTQQEQLSC